MKISILFTGVSGQFFSLEDVSLNMYCVRNQYFAEIMSIINVQNVHYCCLLIVDLTAGLDNIHTYMSVFVYTRSKRLVHGEEIFMV